MRRQTHGRTHKTPRIVFTAAYLSGRFVRSLGKPLRRSELMWHLLSRSTLRVARTCKLVEFNWLLIVRRPKSPASLFRLRTSEKTNKHGCRPTATEEILQRERFSTPPSRLFASARLVLVLFFYFPVGGRMFRHWHFSCLCFVVGAARERSLSLFNWTSLISRKLPTRGILIGLIGY